MKYFRSLWLYEYYRCIIDIFHGPSLGISQGIGLHISSHNALSRISNGCMIVSHLLKPHFWTNSQKTWSLLRFFFFFYIFQEVGLFCFVLQHLMEVIKGSVIHKSCCSVSFYCLSYCSLDDFCVVFFFFFPKILFVCIYVFLYCLVSPLNLLLMHFCLM